MLKSMCRAKPRYRLNDKESAERIERGCRLVEEEYLRVTQQRASNRDALLFTAGEGRGIAVEKIPLKTDFFKDFRPSRTSEKSPPALAGRMQRLSRTVPSNITGGLHDEGGATPQFARIERSDISAIESHYPGGRLKQTVETAKHA